MAGKRFPTPGLHDGGGRLGKSGTAGQAGTLGLGLKLQSEGDCLLPREASALPLSAFQLIESGLPRPSRIASPTSSHLIMDCNHTHKHLRSGTSIASE